MAPIGSTVEKKQRSKISCYCLFESLRGHIKILLNVFNQGLVGALGKY
jgi:hypothetical protein